MANIKFGIPQIKLPTPASINLCVRVFTVSAGIFMLWMQTNNLISASVQGVISSILGLLLALVNGLAPLFGVQVSGGSIPTGDVTAVKEDSMFLNKFDSSGLPKKGL